MADTPRDDASLLQRFRSDQDEAAFGELVRRHGPLVWGVCRRRLDRLEDAEDAFQTTFLILAIKSAAIHRPEALGSWLHRTATRIARRVATQQPRAPIEEQPDAGLDALAEITRREMIAAVDEELQSLPKRYREAIVLFHLEGLARQEVANQLGLSEQTVKARLSRGRSLLRSRLARRGVALPLLLPLAIDPLPAGAAESATRLASTFGRTRITPGDLLTTTLTQGANPMLSFVTGKTGLAVLAMCVGLTIVWAVREPLRAGDGEENRESAIDTRLREELPPAATVPVAMLEDGEDKTEKADERAEEDRKSEDGFRESDKKAEKEENLLAVPNSADAWEELTRNIPEGVHAYYPVPTPEPVAKILEELDKPTRIEYAGIPLRSALENLAQQHEINIVFEEEVIEEEGLSIDENVALFLNGVSLRSALDLLLAKAGLTYGLDNEVLVITTETAAANRVVARAYQVPPNMSVSSDAEFGMRLTRLVFARRESADDAPESTIDVFQDRILVVASLKDHKHLREILRLIYMDLKPPPDE